MDAIFSAVADVLQLIVQPCYALTGNWWISILLFTLITKVVLLPMSLWVQKNSIVMVNVMPEINRIKVKYYGDREAIGEKQQAVFKEKHYHPLLAQVIILFGLVDVIHSITDNGAPGTEFLGMVPVTDGGMSWIMPLLAGLSAVAMGFAQNRINPLQREQHYQWFVDRPVAGSGRVRFRGHVLLLDLLEPVLHCHSGAYEHLHCAGQTH